MIPNQGFTKILKVHKGSMLSNVQGPKVQKVTKGKTNLSRHYLQQFATFYPE